MDQPTLLHRLDHERRTLARGVEVLEQTPFVTRVRSPYHATVFSSLSPENADAAIEAEVDYHRALGAAFEWKLYAHDVPSDLAERLERHGFHIGPREAVLVFDLNEPADWIQHADTRSVVRIDHLGQIDVYQRVAELIFSKNYDLTAGELRGALQSGSSHVRGYIAFAQEQAVSIGRLYTHPGSIFGGLYGGGTLAEFRGRGFYRALVAARARDALAAGASYLIVDALPTSRPILQRLGFQWLTDTWPCQWQPSAAAPHA